MRRLVPFAVPVLLLAFLVAAATGAVAGHGGKDGGQAGEEGGHAADGKDPKPPKGEGDERDGPDGRDDRDHDERDDRDDDHDGGDARGEHGRHPAPHGSGAPAETPAATPTVTLPRAPAAPSAPVTLSADAAVRQLVRVAPGRLTYVFLVGDVGAAPARDVALQADLPELGGGWTLSGEGAPACSVDAASGHLSCAFGTLLPGQLHLVQAVGDVQQPPAWQVLTTATVDTAGGSANAGARTTGAQATSVVGLLLP